MGPIDPEVVESLIALGLGVEPGIPHCLDDPNLAWHKIQGEKKWLHVATSITEPQLCALIRGLVLYSRAGAFIGGSASPIITLYREYSSLYPDLEPSLTEWIVDNRINSYEPFGTVFDEGARDLKTFRLRSKMRIAREEFGKWKREEEAQHQKRLREKEISTSRLANAVRRADFKAVVSLLKKGADPERALPDGRSLVRFAVEHDRVDMANFLRSLGIY